MSTGSLIGVLNDEPWVHQAVCAQVDPELFYPERGGQNEAAKRICKSCPVINQCLEYALARREYGIWGGTSEKQRTRMKNRRAA